MKAGGRKGGQRGKRREESHDVKLSRSLSSILRHRAVEEKIPIRPDGFVRLKDLQAHPKFRNLNMEQVRAVVTENDKQRFALVEESGEFWIRANQGHSMSVVKSDLLLEVVDPETVSICLHGTYHVAWPKIQESGLKRMSRNQIHFAEGLPGENGVISGMRSSCQVMIYINMSGAKKCGLPLYRSANGVLLSPGFLIGDVSGVIPPCLFEKVVDRQTGNVLFSGDVSLIPPAGVWPVAPPENDANDGGSRKKQKSSVDKKIASLLGTMLKHKAEKEGLEIGEDGYVVWEDLKSKVKDLAQLSNDDLLAIVAGSNGQFSLGESADGKRCVRANFGHSIDKVKLELISKPIRELSSSHNLVVTFPASRLQQILEQQFFDVVGSQDKKKKRYIFLESVSQKPAEHKPKNNETDRVLLFIDPHCAKSLSSSLWQTTGGQFFTTGLPSSESDSGSGVLPLEIFSHAVSELSGEQVWSRASE